jgi:hypothetical protein
MESIVQIPKENVVYTRFKPNNHLPNKELIAKLYRAMRLGNGWLQKVAIYFHTQSGPRKIETTVWSASDKYISIKGGVTIPVSCIFRVDIV